MANPSSAPVEDTGSYRADIDVLRGVAISLVVLYHVSPLRFPGGFVGVDVFFVISGYLITGLLVDGMDGDEFRLRTFWMRRMRRLFPALVIALTLALGIGAVMLDGFGLSRLGLYVVSAATFSTNALALSELGYFDSGAVRPLLHLWSLAVEEQFYVLWPLALLLLRRRVHARRLFAVLVFAGSLASCVWLTASNPDLAFFLPFTRFWELVIGGLLAMYAGRITAVAGRVPAGLLVGVGYALIALSFVTSSAETAFPGWAALLPCAGSALVIAGGSTQRPGGLALGSRGLRLVGLISYPLYLYHYILLSYLKQGTDAGARLVQAVAAVAVSVVLAAATYWWLERPMRHGRRVWQRADIRFRGAVGLRRHVAIVAVSLAVLGGCGVVAWRDVYGSPTGDAEADLQWVASGFGRGDLWDTRCFITKPWERVSLFERDGCIDTGRSGDVRLLLVGDSHAGSLAPGIRTWISDTKSDIAMSQITSGWCSLFYGERFLSAPNCIGVNHLAESTVRSTQPDIVVLHMYWIGQLQAVENYGFDRETEFRAVVDKYLALGARRVVVIGPVPLFSEPLPVLLLDEVERGVGVPLRMSTGLESDLWAVDDEMRSYVGSEPRWGSRVKYVSVVNELCEGRQCLVRVGADLRRDVLMWDQSHLTVQASRFLAPRIMKQIIESK